MEVVNKNTSSYKIMTWLAAVFIYMLLHPYFVWRYVGLFNWIVLLPLYVLLLIQPQSSKNKKYLFLFVVLTLLASICNGQNIIGIVFNIGIALVFLPKLEFMRDTYEHFRKIFVVIISISIVSYILVLLGVSLPSSIIPPLNSLKEYNYEAYPFFVRSQKITEYLRFSGPFDEAGALGTASLIILVIERFDLKRFGNIAILASGLLSLSLFFYVALVLYILYLFFSEEISKRGKWIIVIMLGLGAFFVWNNPVTNALIVERIQWDEETESIAGDNRSRANLDDYIDSIRGTSTYFFGLRDTKLRDSFNDSASLNNAILRYGFVSIFFFFVFFFFFAKAYLGFGFRLMAFMAILFAILYNRPSFFEVSRLYMYVMCVYSFVNFSTHKSIKIAGGNKS